MSYSPVSDKSHSRKLVSGKRISRKLRSLIRQPHTSRTLNLHRRKVFEDQAHKARPEDPDSMKIRSTFLMARTTFCRRCRMHLDSTSSHHSGDTNWVTLGYHSTARHSRRRRMLSSPDMYMVGGYTLSVGFYCHFPSSSSSSS